MTGLSASAVSGIGPGLSRQVISLASSSAASLTRPRHVRADERGNQSPGQSRSLSNSAGSPGVRHRG
jgi:hypothetical protein